MYSGELSSTGNLQLGTLEMFADGISLRLERKDGNTKYDHARRIMSIIEREGEITINPAFRLAISIHDLIFTGNRADQDFDPGFLTNYYRIAGNLKPEDLTGAMYALGIAAGAYEYEKAAESWRSDIKAVCSAEPDNRIPFFDKGLVKFLREEHGYTPEVREIITFKSDLAAVLSDSGAQVTNDLLNWRAPLADPDIILPVVSDFDLEALILKAAEVTDNLRHPNPERPAAGWRDAQELLSFYQPLLEVAGFRELAMVCQDEALQFLNQNNSELLSAAHRINDQASTFISKWMPQIVSGIRNTHDDLMQTYARVKTVGSIAEKLRKKDKDSGTVPDAVGILAIASDASAVRIGRSGQSNAAGITRVSNFFLQSLHTYQQLLTSIPVMRPTHTRANEPSLQINFGKETDVAGFLESIGLNRDVRAFSTEMDGYNIQIKLEPERAEGGYQAAHLSFTYGGIGIEVQITTETAYYTNDLGTASHIGYKANGALGKLGELYRQRKSRQAEYEAEQDRFLDMLFAIRRRANFYLTNKYDLTILSPETVKLLQSLEARFNLTSYASQLQETLTPKDYLRTAR
jgi:hypothetical protein